MKDGWVEIYVDGRDEPFSFHGRPRRDLETKNWHYYEDRQGMIWHFRKNKMVAVLGGTPERVKEGGL